MIAVPVRQKRRVDRRNVDAEPLRVAQKHRRSAEVEEKTSGRRLDVKRKAVFRLKLRRRRRIFTSDDDFHFVTDFSHVKDSTLFAARSRQIDAENGQNGESGNSQGAGTSSSGATSSNTSFSGKEERVFSVSETALFFEGKQVGSLDKKQTFAFGAVRSELRLATYTVALENASYTLNVKHNAPSVKLKIEKNGAVKLRVAVTLTAGVSDFSKSGTGNRIKDVGDVPKGVLRAAERALKEDIERTVAVAKQSGSDIFDEAEPRVKIFVVAPVLEVAARETDFFTVVNNLTYG